MNNTLREALPVEQLSVTTNIPSEIHQQVTKKGDVTTITFSVNWKAGDLGDTKPEVVLSWTHPVVDIQYQWYTNCGKDRALFPNWHAPYLSKIASWAPLHCFYNDAGRNRFTIALDAVLPEVERRIGVNEHTGCMDYRVTIPLDASGRSEAYTFSLWIDTTDGPYEDAIRRVIAWWEEQYPPMDVPAIAKMPLYSCWYSLHQKVYEDDVLDEVRRAAALGMKVVIIDDGWQTEDNGGGYAYCGDWQVAPSKIRDMRALSDAIHAEGMKLMIWYSVPFVGKKSAMAKHFEGKMLCSVDRLNTWVLDPRYPEVRSYLINHYVNAVRSWNLDGLKLDFIDRFTMMPESPVYCEGMDYAVLEDAVHVLMVDIMKALKALRSDILIEFRQSYIGPAMREFGNMFRVGDCPNSTSTNRVGIVDLRLTSGSTAVHSDMLMWHEDDRVENAVCQIENVLFSTVQFSPKLSDMTPEHTKAIGFWSSFLQEHVDLLQNAPIYAESPQMLYPLVHTRLGQQAVYACYLKNHILPLPAKDRSGLQEIWLINANSGEQLVLDFTEASADAGVPEASSAREKTGLTAEAAIHSCTGDLLRTEEISLCGLQVLKVPECGFAKLTIKA